jgi:DNA polymerase-3 subunit epsilon/CBS domain-containing protein
MAKNPLWRGSLDLWRERLRDWLARSSPADLLAVDIFFDFRAVYGDGRLAVTLWREAYAMAKGQSAFAKLLAETAGDFEPPLGWFGIRTENSRVDLKRGGLFVIVSVARVLAIYYGIDEHSTKSRIEGIRALGLGSERDLKAMIETQRVILSAILGQQLADIAAGRPPSNKVELKRLSRDEQTELKDALSSIRYSHEMLRDLLVARPF